MSTYYWTCPYCGANLDPGERCDCKESTDSGSPESTNYRDVTPTETDMKTNPKEEKQS